MGFNNGSTYVDWLTLLCLGGILSVDLTVPIVAVQFTGVCVNQKFTISLYAAIFSYPKHKIMRISWNINAKNEFCFWQLVTNYKVVCKFKLSYHRCSAVDHSVFIGEPSAVFSLAEVGCMGVL